MTPFSLMHQSKNIRIFRDSDSDMVRAFVIGTITIMICGVTYISMAAGYGTIVPQLFYFPVLYSTYFYRERGVYVATGCAIAYLLIAASFVPPDPVIVGGVVAQALLFIAVAAGLSFFLNRTGTRYGVLLQDDAEAVRLMIAAGENERVEFKLESLWSSDLKKEEIDASESSEVRKYRNNASRFIIARSIAGFLNTDGGDLIIGIREDRIHNMIQPVGIENDCRKLHEKDRNPDGYRRMLVDSVIRKYIPEIFDTANRFIHISFPVISDRMLCHIRVTPSDKPVFVYNGNEEMFFIRVDASTRPITGKTLTHYILTRFPPS